MLVTGFPGRSTPWGLNGLVTGFPGRATPWGLNGRRRTMRGFGDAGDFLDTLATDIGQALPAIATAAGSAFVAVTNAQNSQALAQRGILPTGYQNGVPVYYSPPAGVTASTGLTSGLALPSGVTAPINYSVSAPGLTAIGGMSTTTLLLIGGAALAFLLAIK